MPSLSAKTIVRPTQTALALNLVSEIDLLRLKTIARLHARGLPPDVGWEDLLQEALTRFLIGTRPQPEGVPIVAFLAGVMRSLRTAHWRRLAGSSRRGDFRLGHKLRDCRDLELCDPVADPERSVTAEQQLDLLLQLFIDDPIALKLIAGLGEGLSAEQIRRAAGLSRTEYESARKRIRRTLLREGLTCASS
jgi:RNA polymerase sigma-70 factor (ECF subfamily)